ncbi:MAG: CHAT domain-containing protein [Cyanobacteria bacterium P01_A01_bin.83]
MLLAFLMFTSSSILSIHHAIAQEPVATASKLTIKGKQLYELGKFDSAARVWQEAVNIYEQLGDEQNKHQSLINVAEALQADGRYLRACGVVLQTFKIDQYNCRNLIELKNSDRAFYSWFKTLQPQSATLTQAKGLHSFGDILQKLGRLDLSEKVLQKSLQIARQRSSSQIEGAVLLSLGNNQQILGDRTQDFIPHWQQHINLPLTCKVHTDKAALPFYQQTLLLYEQAANRFAAPIPWIKIQLNRLNLLLKINARSQALELARQIFPALKQLPPQADTIFLRINLAKNLVCLQQSSPGIAPLQSEVVEILTTAVQQAQNLGDRRSESYALGYLGWSYIQSQQIDQAFSLTRQALFLAQAIPAQDVAYKWQWQLGYLLETQGDIPGAIAAYRNAVDLLQLLRFDLIAVQTKTRFYFQEQVEPVYRQLVDLLLQTDENSALKQVNLQLARQTVESLRLVELENFLQKACLEPKIEIDRIIDRQDSTAAVIYPIIQQQQLTIILKLPGQKKLRYYSTAVSQEVLTNTIAKLESYLPDVTRTSQVNQLSQQIYSWLISPIENDLNNNQIETLVFVLDSFLGNIPMSVLYDGDRQQYLIEQYEIALAPSLQLVDAKPLRNSPMKVLAAGINKKRVIKDREFTSLANVGQELSQIQSKVSSTTELLNNKFTKTNLQDQLKDNTFSIIHLATHSQFSSSLNQTFILTWERLLRIEDMVNLFQTSSAKNFEPIELLVLSACQTAKGDRLASLGLAGITVQSGVNSTLATLWSVDDFSTTQIMNQFYQELNSGATIAKAIQKAQLTILNKEPRPYFWAPFVLLGNWT